jgi:hypothetical protein
MFMCPQQMVADRIRRRWRERVFTGQTDEESMLFNKQDMIQRVVSHVDTD